MTRKHLIIVVLVMSISFTAIFIIGSFDTYAQPISSTEMQNIYLRRILRFGTGILLMQFLCLILVATARSRPNAA